jgi:hypothetical protein
MKQESFALLKEGGRFVLATDTGPRVNPIHNASPSEPTHESVDHTITQGVYQLTFVPNKLAPAVHIRRLDTCI